MIFHPPKPLKRPGSDVKASITTTSEQPEQGTGVPTRDPQSNCCLYCGRNLNWWLEED